MFRVSRRRGIRAAISTFSLRGTISTFPPVLIALLQLPLTAFEQVTAIHWLAHGFEPFDLEGPNLSIEGIYKSHEVWVRILAYPPEDEPPGMYLDALTMGENKRYKERVLNSWEQ